MEEPWDSLSEDESDDEVVFTIFWGGELYLQSSFGFYSEVGFHFGIVVCYFFP
jgi:hypothetical protein